MSINNKYLRRFLIAGLVLLVLPLTLPVLAIVLGLGAHYKTPAASMKPTLNVGEHFYVSKLNYRFSDENIPSRGDIVVFKHPKTDTVMNKRVIGLPTDTVQLIKGRVTVNNQMLRREKIDSFLYRNRFGGVVSVNQYREFIPESDKSYSILEQTDLGQLDRTGKYKIPAGHVFVMGDNRDNSIDSRSPMLGFIPVENIIGRATYSMFNFKRCKVEASINCPQRQFLKKL